MRQKGKDRQVKNKGKEELESTLATSPLRVRLKPVPAHIKSNVGESLCTMYGEVISDIIVPFINIRSLSVL